MIRAVLFDFDGTLADTAPDLGHALNRQRMGRGMPSLPIDLIRTEASSGARGLLGMGFQIKPGDRCYEEMCIRDRPYPPRILRTIHGKLIQVVLKVDQ